MVRCSPVRPSLILYVIIVTVLCSCVSVPPPTDPTVASVPVVKSAVSALAWVPGGEAVVVAVPAETGCVAQWRDAASGVVRANLPLSDCPSSLRFVEGGTLLATAPESSWLLGEQGAAPSNLWDLGSGGVRLERADGGVRVSGTLVPLEGRILSARWIPNEAAAVVLVRSGGADRLIRVAAGEVPAVLAGPFDEIDSFDLDPHGNELVFSARRSAGFDVALAPTEPGEPRWIPSDRLDERLVSWAPRGNKVTYAIEGGGATVLRTVHIPTGFQLGISLPWSRVDALAWDPAAERFAVALAAPDRSDRIEVMRYGGEERRVLVPPVSELDSRAEALEGVVGAVLLQPDALRYNEKVPAVVWVEREPLEWSADRARLHQNRSVATVVVPEQSAGWMEAVTALPWVDPARIFVVVDRVGSELMRSLSETGATVLTRESPPSKDFEVIRTDSLDLRRFAADWIESRLESAKR